MSPDWTSQGTGPWGMSGSWEDGQAESGAGPQAVATSDPGPPAATVEMDDFQPQPSPFGQQMLSFRVFLLLKPHVLASETLSPSDCWSKTRFLYKFSRTFITSILKKAGGSSEIKAHTSTTSYDIISAVFLGNRPRQPTLCNEATKGMAWFV